MRLVVQKNVVEDSEIREERLVVVTFLLRTLIEEAIVRTEATKRSKKVMALTKVYLSILHFDGTVFDWWKMFKQYMSSMRTRSFCNFEAYKL